MSNYICCLSAKNEQHIYSIMDNCINNNIKFSIFREPDLNNEITAIALEPGQLSKKLCSNLRLALS